jgi:hypothetical protein
MWRCLATQKLPANPPPTKANLLHPSSIAAKMAPTSIADLVAALPSEDSWGPASSADNMLNGVPYAPFSKGDKLGRMADWTAESKDRERQGRQQYNRNFRGMFFSHLFLFYFLFLFFLVIFCCGFGQFSFSLMAG